MTIILGRINFIEFLQPWHRRSEVGEYLGKVVFDTNHPPFAVPHCHYGKWSEPYYPGDHPTQEILLYNGYSGFSPGCNIAGGRDASDPF